jgi:cytochrome c-type biogenesis protein
MATAFMHISPWAVVLAFFLGLLATFTPATFPLAPVIVGYIGSSARARASAWGRALAFLAGVSLVTVAIGALFGAAGVLAQMLIGGNLAIWNGLAGLVTLVVGLGALGVVPLPLRCVAIPRALGSSWLGAFTLGLPFGLVTCPTCVPLLVPVALGAAASGSAWHGGLFFLAFAVGRGLPLLLVGGAAGAVNGWARVSRYAPVIERASALLMLAAALYFFVQAGSWAYGKMSAAAM